MFLNGFEFESQCSKPRKINGRKAKLNKTFAAEASNKNGLSTFYNLLVES